MTVQDLDGFTKKLLYEFKDKNLLDEALRHSSFVNEQNESLRDNERFEFLGDAVLSLVIGHMLMQQGPDLKEGELSMLRAGMVNEEQLAVIARSIDLGIYLNLGKGEIQTLGRVKNSILADSLEAVIAAIYLDGGFDAAFRVISTHFSSLMDYVSVQAKKQHYKSRLQEIVQSTHQPVPRYSVIHESGPDHQKTFRVQLKIGDLVTEGIGKSKK